MARLYSNENFPFPVVEELRRLGHDVATMLDRGQAGKAVLDPDVLELAIAEDRAILTLNRRDFIRLHKQRPNHAGIVVCTLDRDFQDQAKRIDIAIRALSNLQGELIRVNRPI